MGRLVLLALCACIASATEPVPADLGGPAPDFAGATWLKEGVPAPGALTLVAFWLTDDGFEQPILQRASALAAEHPAWRIVLVGAGAEQEARQLAARPGTLPQALAGTELLIRWLGSIEAPLPAWALVGADGILLWRGPPGGFEQALAREIAGGFDRARLAEAARKRGELRMQLAAHNDPTSLDRAFALTAELLALDPVDEEAVRLRLDLCRHRNQREKFRQTLAALPLDRLPPEFANALAWECATDDDVVWRHPDLALKLVEHARRQLPEEGEVEDTYARVLYILGLIDDAVASQLRAVSLRPDDETMRDVLDYYREIQGLRAERAKKIPGP